MRRNLINALLVTVCLIGVASIAGAATVNCTSPSITNVATSLGPGDNVCDVPPDLNILFSNFLVSPTSATVGIDSVDTAVVGNQVQLGLQLSGLPSSGNFDIIVTYEVTGGIDGIDLGFTSSGPGNVMLTELACTGQPNSTGCTGTQLANINATSTGSLATASATFATTQTVYIQKDIQFNNGGTLSVVENSVMVPVPEPVTLLLVGGALCGIALIRRRSARS